MLRFAPGFQLQILLPVVIRVCGNLSIVCIAGIAAMVCSDTIRVVAYGSADVHTRDKVAADFTVDVNEAHINNTSRQTLF